MKIKSSIALAIAAIALFGVAVELSRASGLPAAMKTLSYYTLQSNLIVAAVCLLAVLKRGAGRLWAGSTLWIMVTGIVYHVLLSISYAPSGLYAWSNAALHYATPAAMLLAWIFLEKRGALHFRDAVYWLGYPLLYVLGSLIRGSIDGFYPYWFLDPVQAYPKGMGSFGAMTLAVSGLFLFFGALGLGMVALDRALASRAKPS